MTETEAAVNFIRAHNRPGPCLKTDCPFCWAWDHLTEADFAASLLWVLGQQTEVIQ